MLLCVECTAERGCRHVSVCLSLTTVKEWLTLENTTAPVTHMDCEVWLGFALHPVNVEQWLCVRETLVAHTHSLVGVAPPLASYPSVLLQPAVTAMRFKMSISRWSFWWLVHFLCWFTWRSATRNGGLRCWCLFFSFSGSQKFYRTMGTAFDNCSARTKPLNWAKNPAATEPNQLVFSSPVHC